MKIKLSNIFILFMLVSYFAAQIMTGALRIAGLLVCVAFAIVIIIQSNSKIWMLIFTTLLLQMSVQRMTTGTALEPVKYFDEVVEVAAVAFLAYIFVKKKIQLSDIERLIIFLYGGYLLMCIFSSFIHNYASLVVIVLDAFVCLKFFIFYRTGVELSRRNIVTFESFGKMMRFPAKCITVILLILSVHDILMAPFFEKFDFRFLTQSLQLCFQHPTYLAAACITLITVFICSSEKESGNFKYILILTVITVLSFRMKAIGSLIIIFTIYFAYVKFNLPFKGLLFLCIISVAVYLSLDQFQLYFTTNPARDYAPIRLKMMRDGITIANDHFPFGAGFGTFGTVVAYENQSPFYYSMHYMYGYYKEQPVMDTFWPGIFAQSGWIGTVLFASTVVLMVVDSLTRIRENKYAGWCMLSIILTTIIESAAATAFFNPATAVMLLIYGVAADRSHDSKDPLNAIHLKKPRIKIKF